MENFEAEEWYDQSSAAEITESDEWVRSVMKSLKTRESDRRQLEGTKYKLSPEVTVKKDSDARTSWLPSSSTSFFGPRVR